MSNWLNIEQNTPEWLNIRSGLFTSSNIYNLFVSAKKGEEFSKSAHTYIKQKAIETIYPFELDNSFSGKAIQWGNDNEQDAVNVYEVTTGSNVTNGGFFVFDDYTGSSPDGLVDTDGQIEIKCPYVKVNHLNNVLYLNDDVDLYKKSKQYYYQVHHQLYCSGRSYVDFMSFDPRLLSSKNFLHVIRIERNQELMEQMAEVIYKAGKEKDRIIEQFLNR